MTTTVERVTIRRDEGVLSALGAGPRRGHTILLLHGIPTGAELFRDVMPLLADAGYRVIAPDMPGYGGSRLRDGGDYSLSNVADLLARWLADDELAPAWLVGHDLGGAVAQLLASRYPELFARVTMGNAPTPSSFPVFSVSTFILAARLRIFPAVKLVPNPYVDAELKRAFSDPTRLTEENLERVFWDSKFRTPEGRREFAKHLLHLRNTENVHNAANLKSWPMPVSLLWGDADKFQRIDRSAKELQALLPAGTPLDVIPGAGHFAPLEKPREYATGLLRSVVPS